MEESKHTYDDIEEKFYEEGYLKPNGVASVNEYTGLISAGIENKDEAENYSESFKIPAKKQTIEKENH